MKKKITIKGKKGTISNKIETTTNQNVGRKISIKKRGMSPNLSAPKKVVETPIQTPKNISKSSRKTKKSIALLLIIIGLGLVGYFIILPLLKPTEKPETTPKTKDTAAITTVNNDLENQPYKEFDLTKFHVLQSIINDEKSIEQLLENIGGGKEIIKKVSDQNNPNLTNLNKGRPYTLLSDKTDVKKHKYLIYENSKYQYIIVNLTDGKITSVERKIQTRINTVAGMIKGEESLLDVVLRNQFRPELIEKMEEALKWSVDFHHIKAGDKFKVTYDEKVERGEVVGIGQIYAVYFETDKAQHYAYNYEYQGEENFYSADARPMRASFLMSPVKYARISSAFNLKRKHPVTGVVKGHFGTDYAAPEGTPILAVADGIVTKAEFKKNNGNYVKLKHDEVYQTQYLHMQKIEDGIKPNVKVKQGQVIGYVGETGLATGPHVCFRFWKNNQQVNHLEEDLPLSNPLAESEQPDFFFFRDSLNRTLETITYYK